jgi:hypothetical protein
MGEYLVNAYQPGFFLYCRPKKKPFTHRFPSTATPSFLTAPHNGTPSLHTYARELEF